MAYHFVKFGNGIFHLEDPNSPSIFIWTSPFPPSPSTFFPNNNISYKCHLYTSDNLTLVPLTPIYIHFLVYFFNIFVFTYFINIYIYISITLNSYSVLHAEIYALFINILMAIYHIIIRTFNVIFVFTLRYVVKDNILSTDM